MLSLQQTRMHTYESVCMLLQDKHIMQSVCK